ncbi:MAG: hypothetical protein H0V33_13350 [Acidimicrobiia bacterium]|nr:hypothetical protein [Acidimicrobiia bacterium]
MGSPVVTRTVAAPAPVPHRQSRTDPGPAASTATLMTFTAPPAAYTELVDEIEPYLLTIEQS